MSSLFRLLSLCLVVTVSGAFTPLNAQDTTRAQALAEPLLDTHPLAMFQTAIEVFEAGQKEEAVYLFYLGQLRWRRYINARPNLPPDQDRALFAAMQDVIGRPINEWAFGDMDWLIATLRALDAHDAATPDRLTPATRFADVHAQSRKGFAAFIDMLEDQADAFRAERTANGLENR